MKSMLNMFTYKLMQNDMQNDNNNDNRFTDGKVNYTKLRYLRVSACKNFPSSAQKLNYYYHQDT